MSARIACALPMVEIKCPLLKTHLRYLLDGKLPLDYFQQVQGSLYITGFDEWDFMSFYPGIKPFIRIKPFIITVTRNEDFIKNLDAALDEFCFQVIKYYKKLREV